MLSKSIRTLIVNRVLNLFGHCTIILFGSYAYGSPKESSDLDIAIIKNTCVSKIKESAQVWNLLKDIPVPKDIIVTTYKEFDYYKPQAGSIFKTIHEKGIVLHAG